MPQRTNAFQAVVYLIKKHLGDDKTTVVESAMLEDRRTGEQREVDVLIETEASGHTVRIGVECAARGRRQTVEWVEQINSKHADLPTHHLVLVSESGFTASAVKKAKALGIETIVPSEVTDTSASVLAHRLTRVRFSTANLFGIDNVWLNMGPTALIKRRENVHFPPELAGADVFTKWGQCVCTLKDVVLGFMAAVQVDQAAAAEMLESAPDDAHFYELVIPGPKIKLADADLPVDIYLKPNTEHALLEQIELIKVEGKAEIVRADFKLTRGMFDQTAYSWGSTVVDGKETVLVLTADDENGIITMTPQSVESKKAPKPTKTSA
jgi:hypothetical protein